MTQVAMLTMAQLMPDEAMSVVEPVAGPPMPTDHEIARFEAALSPPLGIDEVPPALPAPSMVEAMDNPATLGDRILAGSYEVHPGVTPWQLILKLSSGDVSQGELRFVEGWSFRQVRAALEASPDLAQDTVGLSDAEILRRIGATEAHPEGLFFPDTYLFDKQSSSLAVLARAYRAMQERLALIWEARSPDLPLASRHRSPGQAARRS